MLLFETPTGSYQVIYRNIFHAAYLIAKTESIFALQKGNIEQKFSSLITNPDIRSIRIRIGTRIMVSIRHEWLPFRDLLHARE